MHTPLPPLQRVLFVDDEPAILTGLSRMLRPLHKEIQSEFAGSGVEALERLAKEPFDIVIADIRMPAMDGAALLEAVQRDHPHIIRMVLSGHADVSAALRLVPVAHQFLAKPCDAAILRAVIRRAASLHLLLRDRTLQALVTGMKEIPARPRTYTEMSKLLADPLSTSSEMAQLISCDVAMTAQLLMIVNSPFFGLPRRVSSIESAINYLGTTMLRSVILATAASASLGPPAQQLGYDFAANETHGLLSANLAMQFFTDKNAREDAFAASLLQNVGELLLIAAAPDDALVAITRAREASLPLEEVERDLGVVSHAAMGAYLLSVWGLPYNIVEAVAHHHAPWNVVHETLDVVDAVHIATSLADHYLLSRPQSLESATAHLARFGAEARLSRLRTAAEHWLNPAVAST